MRPTQRRALMMARLLGLILLCPAWGVGPALTTHASPSSPEDRTGPLIAVSPVTLSLSGLWRFAADPEAVGHTRGWTQSDFNDDHWRTVAVPHTWNVMPEYANYTGIAWY